MKKVIYTILFAKVSIFLLIFLAFSLLPFSKAGYYFNFHYPANSQVTLTTTFSTWDAQHYLFLAQKGYHPGEESNRFFPLFPSLIRLFAFAGGYFFSGLCIANIFSIIGFIYFYLFVKDFTKKESIAYKSLLVFLVFPTSFYFSLIYSEGIFLGIVMPLFYYLRKKKILYVALCAFLLPLARPTGILICFPLFVNAVLDYMRSKTLHVRFPVILPFMPLLGLLLYFLFMFHTTGNLMTGFASQGNVVGHWQISAIIHPQIFLQNIFPHPLTVHGFTNSLLDRISFLFFIALLPLVWKKTNPTLFSYVLIMGMVPLFGSFMSYTRYLVLAFPIFISLGIFFSEQTKKQFVFSYIYICLLLQALFIVMHSLNYWVA